MEEIFFFVNPKSGGNKGQDFLKVPQPFVTPVAGGKSAVLFIYSLLENASEGFKKLKQVADARRAPVRTIVGGGDGTVMWADAEATKHGIDTPTQCIFGIVPLGTGNDFSRVAGWGGKNPKGILNDDCQVLRTLVQKWVLAQVRPHDVWLVDIDVDDKEGQILKVSDKKEKDIKDKTISARMINYFSIGQESKVGVEFDKNRTKSQTCNLCVYAAQGFGTEIDCTSQQHVGDLVSSMHAGNGPEDPMVFGYSEDSDVPELMGNPESLLFLNVNSYAGGAANFWQRTSPCGVDPEPEPADVEVDDHPGDGRIEVVSLPNIAHIALDKLTHAASRIHSGGPYYLEFFGPSDGHDELHAYCQVDGEFYHLVNPLTVAVTYCKKLQVLQNTAKEEDLLSKVFNEVHKGAVAVGQGVQVGIDGMQKGAVVLGQGAVQGAAVVTHGLQSGIVGVGDGVVTGFTHVGQAANTGILGVHDGVQSGLTHVNQGVHAGLKSMHLG